MGNYDRGDYVVMKATPPIDLLRELRAGFEAEARHYRETPNAAGAGPKAYAAEQAVKKIDATLRDWA